MVDCVLGIPAALALAMARDGSSGGVIRTAVIGMLPPCGWPYRIAALENYTAAAGQMCSDGYVMHWRLLNPSPGELQLRVFFNIG